MLQAKAWMSGMHPYDGAGAGEESIVWAAGIRFCRPGATDPGMTGGQTKSGGDGVDLPVGNVLAAAIGDDVVPDMVQVGAGLR